MKKANEKGADEISIRIAKILSIHTFTLNPTEFVFLRLDRQYQFVISGIVSLEMYNLL